MFVSILTDHVLIIAEWYWPDAEEYTLMSVVTNIKQVL